MKTRYLLTALLSLFCGAVSAQSSFAGFYGQSQQATKSISSPTLRVPRAKFHRLVMTFILFPRLKHSEEHPLYLASDVNDALNAVLIHRGKPQGRHESYG